MGIGERIRQRRSELGMSQRDLADRMGYNNHSTVAKIENGTVDIPHSRIVQFAEVLSVSVEFLMGLDTEARAMSPNKLGQRIKNARLAKGMTQWDLAELLGVQNSAVAKYEKGRIVNLKQATLLKLSEILEIPISELLTGIEEEQSSEENSTVPDGDNIPGMTKSNLIEERQNLGSEKQQADSRTTFSTNLRLYMAKTGKSRKEISEAIGVSYFTFSDWCNGKKYPRIEKLEALAEYFGVSVPELIDSRKSDKYGTSEIVAVQKPADTELERIDTFANRLQLAMNRTGIKRIELVKAAGIDQGAMTNYIKGKFVPKHDTVAKLAKILNVSERWLLGYGSEEMVFEDHIPVKNQEQKAKEDVLDIILRLHTDVEFLKIVEKMNALDSEKLKALEQFLKAFGE